MTHNDDITVFARLAIYGKRYGITLTDYGEITISDAHQDIGNPINRKLSVDDIGPVLIDLWERIEREKQFINGIEELKKESVTI
jgi:hypothetical protein